MTREQRWIRRHERSLARTIELATAIKGALSPNAIANYRRELATIRSIRRTLDRSARRRSRR